MGKKIAVMVATLGAVLSLMAAPAAAAPADCLELEPLPIIGPLPGYPWC